MRLPASTRIRVTLRLALRARQPSYATPGRAAAQAAIVHLDNTLQDYRREIQRRVFGDAGRPGDAAL